MKTKLKVAIIIFFVLLQSMLSGLGCFIAVCTQIMYTNIFIGEPKSVFTIFLENYSYWLIIFPLVTVLYLSILIYKKQTDTHYIIASLINFLLCFAILILCFLAFASCFVKIISGDVKYRMYVPVSITPAEGNVKVQTESKKQD